ncbi:sulfuric ester hydrolase [Aureococcus anophagefferens]|nr:sulfuric ester hydrolase [Aureococcus anophagefferens]
MGGTRSLVLLAACSRALQPDILLLIADDVGFNGVGYQSDYTNVSNGFLTPRLDALAAESLKLSSFYVLPLCAPTRAALLTGRYPTRYGLSAFNADWGKPWGLPANETLLPEVLKAANYTTGLLGKWHLGSHRDAALPQSRGFDVFRGFYSGGLTHFTHDTGVYSYAPSKTFPDGCHRCVTGYDFHDGAAPAFDMNGTYSADAVRDAAVAFVRTAQRPFYAQCAFQNVHEPLEVPARFADRYAAALPARERVYAGMVSALDEAAGIVLDALPALDETVVVFFSDNGAMADSAAPSGARANYFKGGKTLTTEGGTRAPCFVRYPPLLSPGWSASLVHVVDLFPTLVALAGATHALDLDGVDGAAAPRPRHSWPPPGSALQHQSAVGRRRPAQGAQGGAALRRLQALLRVLVQPQRRALYDLAADPMETSDVANRHPGVVRDLAARLEAHAARLPPPFEPWPPFQGADYACCDCEDARGAPAVWAPWIPDDYAAAPCAPPYAACVVPPCYGH